ncbi:flagellar export chaperone FliS [Sporolactobacillus shoreae]|uniref:Flagellar secretion chaperone FliS n=1 Tax=Sporolactobacillus shoreae TaxID=1465501 RepID=A0A4Z0GNH4_9BACL|nr:flagellar export chaperone FliS [Sporolactobacillus shoreae]TGA97400.1 flagellar export chaperone FliS [Sporolactobacillus shoreae]
MPANAYQTYQRNSILTASQGELILALYNGCLKFIRLARVAMNNKDMSSKNTYLQKAQSIILELTVTLDEKQPISEDIARIYNYIRQRLIQANLKNDPDMLDEAEKLVADFRDTWKQVVEKVQKNKPRQDRI